jgi:hypothetical protein
LFGTASSVKTSFEEALESLEQVVATQTQQFLGDDLQPTTTEPTTTAEYKTFNDAMEGVDADDADANVPFDP